MMRSCQRLSVCAVAIFSSLVLSLGFGGCSKTSEAPNRNSSNGNAGSSRPPEQSGDPAKKDDAPPREIHAERLPERDKGGLAVHYSMCALMERYVDRVGGVYEVKDIVHFPYEHPGKTFVHLEEKEAWGSHRIRDQKLEFNGGPTPDGGWKRSDRAIPAFVKGETVVILFERVDGRLSTGPQLVFQRRDGGYTNGMLYERDPVSLEELKVDIMDLHRAVQRGDDCPYNIGPKLK